MSADNRLTLCVATSFEDFSGAVVALATDGSILFANKTAAELFEIKREVLTQQRLADLFLNPDQASTLMESLSSVHTEKQLSSQHVLRRSNETAIMVEVTSSPLIGEDHETLGHLLFLKDVTEQSALEALVSHAADTLEDALESINEGFALYDKDDKLVVCNNNYKEIYAHSAPAIIPGNSFEDIIRFGLDKGQYNTEGKTDDDWLAERVKRHQLADASIVEQNLADGRWLQIAERRTRSGGIAGIRTDITELKNAQAANKRSIESLETLANSLSSSIVEADLDGICCFVNDVAANWMATTREELIGHRMRDRLPEPERIVASTQFKRAREGERTKEEISTLFPDGVRRDVLLEYIPKRDENGDVIGVITFGIDITDRKNKERTLAELYSITSSRELGHAEKVRKIVELGCSHFSLPVGTIWNAENSECVVCHVAENEATTEKLHIGELTDIYSSYTLKSGSCIAIDDSASDHEMFAHEVGVPAIETVVGAPIIVDGKYFGNITFFGTERRDRVFSQTDREIIRQIADWIGNEIARQQDHDALIAAQVRLEQIASTDDLTKIFNRRAFFKLAARDIARFRRTGTTFSVLMIDVDHFKKINDNFGHAVGDAVLKKFADIIAPSLRAVDIFGRIGGEEFCVILHNTGVENALLVAERLREEIEVNCMVSPMQKPPTCSIGISEISATDVEFTSILQRADAALYQSKHTGRNKSTIHSSESERPITV